MTRWSLSSATSNLQRYRPTLYVLTAVAAGFAIYYILESASTSPRPTNSFAGLHRSNARRQRRSQAQHRAIQAATLQQEISVDFLYNERDNNRIHGWQRIRFGSGEVRQVPLFRGFMRSWNDLRAVESSDERVAEFLIELEDAFLWLYLFHHLNERQISQIQHEVIVGALEEDGFSRQRILLALDLHDHGQLRATVHRWILSQAAQGQSLENIVADAQLRADWLREHGAWNEAVTMADTSSEKSWGDGDSSDNEPQAGRNLLNLLFAIADEQHRREGTVHTGIGCNSCNAYPIRGIRYRCTNCLDYDLCEVCEAQQVHIKTHIFYKVRVPRTQLGHQPQPVKYPGDPTKYAPIMSRKTIEQLNKRTGFKDGEIEGLLEQFQCTASADWPADPFQYRLAIDRRGFEQLFIATDSTRPQAPNLIYDRIFSFYDTDNNGLIGFYEFIEGLSSLRKMGPKEKWKRIFRGFDVDEDGFINRKDFLRMFRAHYAITKEMTAEIVATMEEESREEDAHELVSSAQPISSGFSHSAPSAQTSRLRHGKDRDLYGDHVIIDRKGVVDENEGDSLNSDEIIAQRAEAKEFGNALTSAGDHKSRSAQEIVKEIYEDPWPPSWLITSDLDNPASAARDLHEISDRAEQRSARRNCHKRWALEWQERFFVRLQAVKDRRDRHVFFDNVEPPSMDGKSTEHDVVYRYRNRLASTNIYSRFAKRGGSQEDINTFLGELDRFVATHDWCIDPKKLRHLLLVIFEAGWTKEEIAESLRGFALDDGEIDSFVAEFLALVHQYAPTVPPSYKEGVSAKPSRRSRSSSKVRFDDGWTADGAYGDPDARSVTSVSSRSIPVNERWGGLDIPEPEEDFGREILLQVTQEAMNEIIDPLLKIREDLWLAAQATKDERQRYKEEMCDNLEDPTLLSEELHNFIKQGHLKQDYPPRTDSVDDVGRSEADNFHEFFYQLDARVRNNLTSEDCHNCSGRIEIGRYCVGCGSGSTIARHRSKDQSLKTENCTICAETGRVSRVKQNEYCGTCAHPSSERVKEIYRLWVVVSGCEDRASMEREKTLARCAQNLAGVVNWEFEHKKAHPRTTVPDIYGSAPSNTLGQEHLGLSRAGLSAGTTTPGGSGSNQPPIPPNGGQTTAAAAIVDTDRMGDQTQYPSTALDLHHSGQAFNEVDLSIEVATARKPLSELLDESGYSAIDVDADPSPPLQSRQADSTDHSPRSSSLQPSPSVEGEPHIDPTLPQNRPSTDDTVDSVPGAKPNDSTEQRPPSPSTLRFWAALTILEAEDEERGGPGRLTEQEFLDIMFGERGKNLEFVGEWLNLAAF